MERRRVNATALVTLAGALMLGVGLALQCGVPVALIVLGALALLLAVIDVAVDVLRGSR